MKHTTATAFVLFLLLGVVLVHGLDLIVPGTFSSASMQDKASTMMCKDKCVSWREIQGKMKLCIRKEQDCQPSENTDMDNKVIAMRMLTM